ncbi:MAG: MBL fold metallo-hydrolase [Caulobacteraceae bacterium]
MVVIRLALAAMAFSFGGCARGAVVEGPVATPPAAVAFRLGALSLTSLRDAAFVVPNNGQDIGAGAGPAAVAGVLAAAGAAGDRLVLSVNALLVRMPGRLVLIDTGLGPTDHGGLPASLALAGVSPDQITDVLITHGHGDHVGGLLRADGKPAFPRATVRMSAREWAWMKGKSANRALVAAIAPKVVTFAPGRPVLPGITPIALYGHTPGHVGYEIVSAGQRLEDIGDIAHSSIVSLARPDWADGFDEDRKAGETTRRAELARLAAGGERVFAPHFPFPGVGRIVNRGSGFAWRPGLPATR